MATHLSKSRVLSGLQCPKRLWLEKNRPELVAWTAASRRRLQGGHRLNEVVHRLVPDGILIAGEPDLGSALRATQYHLRHDPGRPLFEATFSAGGVLIRADVLWPLDGSVVLTEVKSSTRVKPYHLTDCTVQAWVLQQAGLTVERVELAHVDTEFIYPGGGDYHGLLRFVDVSAEVDTLLPDVPAWVGRCREALAGGEPDVAVGPHCREPFDCPFLTHCTPPGPAYPVESLPTAGPELIAALHAEGHDDIRKIPPGRLAKPLHEWVREVTAAGMADIRPELVRTLRNLPYPRYFLDFETSQFAAPIWADTRPYEQLPFQWSCHVERADGAVEHREFLDTSGRAPMRAFADALLTALGDSGPVVVYSAFEKTILAWLATRYPDLAVPIEAIKGRLFDLLKVLKTGYYHPDMHGSWSIKAVLPTLVPDTGYDALEEVRDGATAQTAYDELIDAETAPERRSRLRRALLAYCRLDTWAMLALVRMLSGSIPPQPPPRDPEADR